MSRRRQRTIRLLAACLACAACGRNALDDPESAASDAGSLPEQRPDPAERGSVKVSDTMPDDDPVFTDAAFAPTAVCIEGGVLLALSARSLGSCRDARTLVDGLAAPFVQIWISSSAPGDYASAGDYMCPDALTPSFRAWYHAADGRTLHATRGSLALGPGGSADSALAGSFDISFGDLGTNKDRGGLRGTFRAARCGR